MLIQTNEEYDFTEGKLLQSSDKLISETKGLNKVVDSPASKDRDVELSALSRRILTILLNMSKIQDEKGHTLDYKLKQRGFIH